MAINNDDDLNRIIQQLQLDELSATERALLDEEEARLTQELLKLMIDELLTEQALQDFGRDCSLCEVDPKSNSPD